MEENNSQENEAPEEFTITDEEISEIEKAGEPSDIKDLNEKYLRLYADFENYKKRVNKDKEELVRYGNESLLYELLPAIDNLELALKHAPSDSNISLVQGVEITLKELHRTLEKFGLSKIEAVGKEFDPSIHHAMMNVEREDMDDKMVVEELRTGYIYNTKVLRPSLVSVSVKPKTDDESKESEESGNESFDTETETELKENEIKIKKEIDEED